MLNTCQAQRDFIRQSIMANIRLDGRKNNSRRTPTVKKEVIAHLPGSSYVYIEYENVEIYTGVKINLEEKGPNSRNLPLLLQLSTMRRLSTEQNEELQRLQCVLQETFISKLAVSQELAQALKIAGSKKHQLIMHIDVFLLSPPHLCELQLIMTGIRSAVEDTKIPEILVAYNEVTEEETVEMSGNSKKLNKSNWDEVVIVGFIQEGENPQFVVDLKRQQFESMNACFLVVLEGQKVKSLQCIKGRCSIDTINRCVKFITSSFKTKGDV